MSAERPALGSAAPSVAIRNIAFNLFGRVDQRNSVGEASEAFKALTARLDDTMQRLSLSEEQKSQALIELAHRQKDLASVNAVVSGFLTAITREHVPEDQFAATFFRLIADWRDAGARIDALGASQNLTPRLAGWRDLAAKAHAAGDLAEAERWLAEIDREEQAAEAGLQAHQQEISQELALRREGRLATKDAQIALALARLAPADAARLIAEKIALQAPDPAEHFARLRAEQDAYYLRGRDLGLNTDLAVAIELARLTLDLAGDSHQRGAARNDLGLSQWQLGEREGGTARLEAAVATFSAALEDFTRKRAPFDWAMTLNNLGNVLAVLGERESGTARLEAAVAAHSAVLEERSRERAPLDWATTQNNLGGALFALGARESGTARLEAAVAAYSAALEERTRERAPLDWATIQNNLGNALRALGDRENGTARLEAAVAAYSAVLEERRRERVPLQWATTQNNLGAALQSLGERESGTARLEAAVAAYSAALEERTRERAPFLWAGTQYNLANTLALLAERGDAPARMDAALAHMRGAAEIFRQGQVEYWLPFAERRIAEMEAWLAGRGE